MHLVETTEDHTQQCDHRAQRGSVPSGSFACGGALTELASNDPSAVYVQHLPVIELHVAVLDEEGPYLIARAIRVQVTLKGASKTGRYLA